MEAEIDMSKEDLDQLIAIRKGTWASVTNTPYPMRNYLKFTKASSHHMVFLTTLNQEIIPKNSDEALKYLHGGKQWQRN